MPPVADPGNEAPAVPPVADPGNEAPAVPPAADPGNEAPAVPPAADPGNAVPAVPPAADPGNAVPVVQNKIVEINAKLDNLGKSLEDGELDFAEYNKQLNQLHDEKLQESLRVSRETTIAEIHQQNATQEWQNAQNIFFVENPTYSDQIKYASLNAAVQQIAQDNSYQDKSYAEILNAAKISVDKAFGVQQAVPKSPATQKTSIPQTLGEIPAAVANSTGNSFAHIDSLDGEALEAAVSKMSEAEQERWAKQ